MKSFYSFPATFERGSDGEFGVYFNDLPGMTSGGETFDEARRDVKQGLAGHLALMLQKGFSIPEATALNDVPCEENERVEMVTVSAEDIEAVLAEFERPVVVNLRLSLRGEGPKKALEEYLARNEIEFSYENDAVAK